MDGDLNGLRLLFTHEPSERWEIGKHGLVHGPEGIGAWEEDGPGGEGYHWRRDDWLLVVKFERPKFGGPDTWHYGRGEWARGFSSDPGTWYVLAHVVNESGPAAFNVRFGVEYGGVRIPHRLTAQRRQPDRLPVLVRELEVRGSVTWRHHRLRRLPGAAPSAGPKVDLHSAISTAATGAGP